MTAATTTTATTTTTQPEDVSASARYLIDEYKIWNEGRVISLMEAVYIQMQIAQLEMFPTSVNVPMSIPEEQLLAIKSEHAIMQLPRKSKDIAHFNAMDFYYRRPPELDALTYVDFASQYSYATYKAKIPAKLVKSNQFFTVKVEEA